MTGYKTIDEARVEAIKISKEINLTYFIIKCNRTNNFYVDDNSFCRNFEVLTESYNNGKKVKL